jgi:hypothetical protein
MTPAATIRILSRMPLRRLSPPDERLFSAAAIPARRLLVIFRIAFSVKLKM